MKKTLIIITLSFHIILFACSNLNFLSTPTPSPTNTLTPTRTPTITPSPTLTPTSTPAISGYINIQIPQYLKEIKLSITPPSTIREWNQLPQVKMDDVRSGAFAEALRQMYFGGQVDGNLDDVERFTPTLGGNTNMYKTYGYGAAYGIGNKTPFYFGRRPDLCPGVFVAIESNGSKQLLFPQLLKVGDKREDIGVMTFGFIFPKAEDLDEFKQAWHNNCTGVKDENIFVVAIHFENKKACSTYSKGYEDYCYNYFENIQGDVETLFKQWNISNVFPKELETVVMLPSRITTIIR